MHARPGSEFLSPQVPLAGQATTRCVFALDPDCKAAHEGREGEVVIRWHPDEADLLVAFSEHVRARDPDFVTGWNTDGFDFGWLGAAAERLGIAREFWDGFSRFRRDAARHRGADPRAKVRFSAPGRVPYDLMQWVKKNRQLEQYGLEFVASTYGCGGKVRGVGGGRRGKRGRERGGEREPS